mmetsp:Transcript_8948/g.28242  ORF Transcript_8948/g.28242 Transcript_8948/m.28242 type:complete len:356 (+) Transcript_8948:925-1992(+)
MPTSAAAPDPPALLARLAASDPASCSPSDAALTVGRAAPPLTSSSATSRSHSAGLVLLVSAGLAPDASAPTVRSASMRSSCDATVTSPLRLALSDAGLDVRSTASRTCRTSSPSRPTGRRHDASWPDSDSEPAPTWPDTSTRTGARASAAAAPTTAALDTAPGVPAGGGAGNTSAVPATSKRTDACAPLPDPLPASCTLSVTLASSTRRDRRREGNCSDRASPSAAAGRCSCTRASTPAIVSQPCTLPWRPATNEPEAPGAGAGAATSTTTSRTTKSWLAWVRLQSATRPVTSKPRACENQPSTSSCSGGTPATGDRTCMAPLRDTVAAPAAPAAPDTDPPSASVNTSWSSSTAS